MASKAAHKRLTKEYVAMQKEPPPFVWAVPDERNILTWNYIIRGPPDSPYAGGEYHGVLLFPSEYPFKPPGIKMYTPSGRFSPDKKICFSMSDFHPGTWNPAWSVATILTGLLSFMLSDEMTTGSVTSSDAHKRAFAAKSHAWNLTQKRFREAFPEHCQPTMVDLPNMGGQLSSSSSSSENTKTNPTPTSPVVAAAAVNAAGVPQSSSVPAPAPAPTQANGAAVVKTNNNDIARPPTTYWGQMMWEKWRWGVLILLAVVVSRISS